MKPEFNFKTDQQSAVFFEQIAKRMMELFSISECEAVYRMNRLWQGQVFIGSEDLLYHEAEDFWAHTVYFGGDSKWWTNPPDLKPLPLP